MKALPHLDGLSKEGLLTSRYWRVLNAGVTHVSLAEYQDELEAIALHTDSVALKAACERASHRFDHVGIIQRAVAQ